MSQPSPAAAPAPRILARLVAVPPRAVAPANDDQPDPAGEALLRAALRLFADHGLGAARHAQEAAELAFFANDRAGYRWWLGVTRTLDRKLATELAIRVAGEAAAVERLPAG